MKLQAEIGVMQPQLKNAWSNWKLEEALDRDFRRSRALPTSQFQISSLQNCVRKKFCCSKPPSLCNLSQQFQEANTDGEMGQNYKSASRLQKGFDLSCFQSTSGEQSAFSPPTHQLITLFSSETPRFIHRALSYIYHKDYYYRHSFSLLISINPQIQFVYSIKYLSQASSLPLLPLFTFRSILSYIGSFFISPNLLSTHFNQLCCY